MAKVTMPQLGESVAEGTIGKWLKQPGDHVDKYEPLLEVITDKVNAEVPSPFEGILREILVEEGATVPNNAEIAVIETADDGAGDAHRGRRGNGSGRDVAAAEPAGSGRAAPARGPPTPAPAPTPAVGHRSRRQRRAPSVRDGARRSRPTAVRAAGRRRPGCPDDPGGPPPAPRARPVAPPRSGHRRRRADHPRGRPGGRRGDPHRRRRAGARVRHRPAPGGNGSRQPAVRPRAAPRPRPARRPARPIVFPAGADEVLVPMTQMRKGIAAQMTRALAVPHAYVHMEVDVTALVRARETAKRDYQAREGISLSYVPFVIKAAVEALGSYPTFNAHWTEPGCSPSGASTWASRSPSTTA